MQADDRVRTVSLSDVPAIILYERDKGIRMTVMYLLVRTEYGETEEEALKRAGRVARWLTDDVARKKTEIPQRRE